METKHSQKSTRYKDKFEKLLTLDSRKIQRIGPVLVCFDREFLIGKGRNSVVYIGLHQDGSEVAVKRILTDKSSFENEVEILVNLKESDHIVNYRAFISDESDDFSYIILDLCEENLEEYIKKHDKEFLERHGPVIIREILTGLQALHCGEKKVLHRDLKPRNILVDVEGHMRLAEFGVSRVLKNDETSVLTCPHGTEDWMAAESIPKTEDDDVKFKRKSDIQVAGMICFYVLTKGEHPFGRRYCRMQNIMNDSPVNLDMLTDPNAKRFVSWLISHEIKDRPDVDGALADCFLQVPPGMEIKHSQKSTRYKDKFEKLLTLDSRKIQRIGPVLVFFDREFLIGKGRDSVVYIGLHQDGSEVAVKRILTDKSSFENEVGILDLVNLKKSNHIVNYRAFIPDESDDFSYIILDLCEENLEEYIKKHDKEFLERHGPVIIREILTGLQVLHCGEKKVLHRDLKPRNILVDVEGHMRLADFGVSRVLKNDETSVVTCPHGTEDWMAAESIPKNEGDDVRFKRKSDIQVAGMICFYVLTKGEHPFGRRYCRMQNIMNDSPVNLGMLTDPNAKRFVSWLISHEIKDRPDVDGALADCFLQVPPGFGMAVRTETIHVTESEKGYIIGRYKSGLDEISQCTNARVFLKNNGICVEGTSEQIKMAENLIKEKLNKKKMNGCIEVDVPVPNEFIGLVIGRNGRNIRQLARESETEIQCTDVNVHEGTDECRIFKIRGFPPNCEKARSLIRKCMEERNMMDEFQLPVEKKYIGLILGKRGENMKRLETKSDTRIRLLSSKEDEGEFGNFIITGSRQNCERARSLIIENIIACKNYMSRKELGGENHFVCFNTNDEDVTVNFELKNDNNTPKLDGFMRGERYRIESEYQTDSKAIIDLLGKRKLVGTKFPFKDDQEMEMLEDASGQLLTPRLVELIGSDTTTKWDRLARLLNIKEAFVDDIRCNVPDAHSKAIKVLQKYKEDSEFDVTELVHWLKYLDIKVPHELSKAGKPSEAKSSSQDIKEQVLDNTQLSPREIERLASYIVSSWQRLAGLLNLFEKEVDNVLQSQLYPQPRQKAAKCLNLYNDKLEKFSRNDLAKYLQEMQLFQARKELLDGTLRKR